MIDEQRVRDAILAAQLGINQYVNIMALLPKVDVSTHAGFQRLFNGFYRIRQRPPDWYKCYYTAMERWKHTEVTFDQALDYINTRLNRCEASFCSKLVATVNPTQPIWDKFILENLRLKNPTYGSPARFQRVKAIYRGICRWYQDYIASRDGQRMIAIFNEMVPEYAEISPTKKIDFILWKTRD